MKIQTSWVVALMIPVAASAFEALPKKPPIPSANPVTPAKVELGKQLYFDPRLSRDGTVSCNSCHNVMAGGDDNRPNSVGIKGQHGGRSAPTVWNSAFMSVQFWDGRAKSLEEQAKGPLTNPIEMGMENHAAVISRIKTIPGYVEGFKKAFPGSKDIDIDQVAMAIATYERTLITPDSPFDLYLKGNKKALSAAAVRGMNLVQSVGCTSCHSGPNFAGPAALPEGTGFYQKFPTYPGSAYDKQYDLLSDEGRGGVTKNAAEKHFFRVPTWRNVALTAPYMHNGKVPNLPEAVRVMAKTQLNKELKEEEVSDIVAFLTSLSGKFPEQKLPRLPGSDGVTLVSE
jgi:cytochrome c peroxidase